METDRRVRKTKKLINEALFTLMQEKSYRQIRINQITERADISRSTFYLHYETKEDVLLSIVDEIIDEYFKTIDRMENPKGKDPAFILFSKWKQNLEKLKLILNAGMEYRIFERLRAFNTQRISPKQCKNPLLDDYIGVMLDGASFALLIRWTRDEASVPVAQMNQLFNALNIPEMYQNLTANMPNFGSA